MAAASGTINWSRDYWFKGKRCSAEVFVILTECERRLRDRGGVPANSLKRTMGEQAALVRLKGVWSPSNRTGAAWPSCSAPHILCGHDNHARDIDTFAGAGIDAVLEVMHDMGLRPVRNVPGEPWHCQDLDEDRVRAVARRYARPPTLIERLRNHPLIPGGRSADVIDVQVYMKRAGLWHGQIAKDVGTYGPALRKAVRQFQRRVGLVADGVVGPKTYAAMRRRYGWRVWKNRNDRKKARR